MIHPMISKAARLPSDMWPPKNVAVERATSTENKHAPTTAAERCARGPEQMSPGRVGLRNYCLDHGTAFSRPPASMRICWPVMYREPSEAKKTTTSLTSSGSI